MKREEAFYYKHLLLLGFSEEYDAWLDAHLNAESPLSDIVLELSLCGEDVRKTAALLHNYCAAEPFNTAVAIDQLRLFFKRAYDTGSMNVNEISAAMYQMALNAEDLDECVLPLWGSFYYLDYYRALVEDGVIPHENFDFAFFSYLNQGIPLDTDRIWQKPSPQKPSLLHKLKAFFTKKKR